tara:strand:- start:250 stop:2115 length:1866 start_codon:yes stop_codon:yes gene_type:complete
MCESINKIFFVFFYSIIFISCDNNDKKYNSWSTYGGDPSGSKYSSLDEINVRNVNSLKLLWTYEAFDKNEKHKNGIQCNPIVIDDRIYLIGPDFNVHSINAENGDLIWKYNPFEEKKISGTIRGVTYYNDGKNGRIFFVAESLLFCLNAKTGQLINSFGSGGKTTINKGFERNTADLLITATSPGIIYEDLLILGSRVSDSHNKKTIPGDIRAFDVFSGDIVWTFNTIPRPGEIGYETWPKDSWKNEYLSVNSWGGFTLDEENGIVFFGTGSPSYDHWGGNRIGDNLFGNCILALNAKNGKRIWHFQTVHHDLWDYDVPCPPNLVEVKIDGKYKKAIAQPTKTGQLFVLDRFTGNPIHPIIEKLVKNSKIPGEITSKTQPFTKPELIYAKNRIENYFNKIDQFEFKGIEDSLIKMNFGELFIPPSEKPTIVFPQFNGGTDWGGAAYDKINRMVYVNNSNEAEWFAMVNLNKVKQTNQTFEIPWIANGHKELKTKNGYPVNDMPWGTLSGINLDLGEIIWQVPLGTYPELEKQGLSPTGTFNMGGPIVTAGGLVFIGATMDERFRAFDKKDGSLMWEYQLEAGAYATPSTFQVNGKQFVIIAGGGQGKPGTKSGNKLYCFGL